LPISAKNAARLMPRRTNCDDGIEEAPPLEQRDPLPCILSILPILLLGGSLISIGQTLLSGLHARHAQFAMRKTLFLSQPRRNCYPQPPTRHAMGRGGIRSSASRAAACERRRGNAASRQ
jgi:hypothetical protein